jgi:hypothetical protein
MYRPSRTPNNSCALLNCTVLYCLLVHAAGAHNLQYLVRTTERKPITVFLQSGTHDFDNSHGSWSLANQTLAQSLHYAGYSYKFAFGEGGVVVCAFPVFCFISNFSRHMLTGEGGHNMVHGGALLPQTLQWLWSSKEPGEAGEAAGEAAGFVGGAAFGWRPAQAYGGRVARL